MRILENKCDILYYNITNKIINHPFLNGVDNIVAQIVKTEGLLAHYGVMFPHEFIRYLKKLRENNDNNTIDEYLENIEF